MIQCLLCPITFGYLSNEEKRAGRFLQCIFASIYESLIVCVLVPVSLGAMGW